MVQNRSLNCSNFVSSEQLTEYTKTEFTHNRQELKKVYSKKQIFE